MSEITDELNAKFRCGASRNAVIGKINRLGLREKYSTARAARVKANGGGNTTERKTTRRITQAASLAHQDVRYFGPSPDVIARKAKAPIDKGPSVAAFDKIELVIIAEPVDIYRLTSKTCRWPLGNVDDRPPYMYCGQIVSGGPYCARHGAINRKKPGEGL